MNQPLVGKFTKTSISTPTATKKIIKKTYIEYWDESYYCIRLPECCWPDIHTLLLPSIQPSKHTAMLSFRNMLRHSLEYTVLNKENWVQGGCDNVSVPFAVTFFDCWRTCLCVTTITKIVNNNTNDKQTSGASLALAEDSPYTKWCLFTLDRLPLLLLLRKN